VAAKKEEILAQCIADVKAGRASVEDCLAKYPRWRRELEPLLKIALAIEPPPEVSPSPAFKARARARLLSQIQAQRPVTKERWLRYLFIGDPSIGERRFKVAAIVIAIVLAVASIGGGTAYASQDALPGDILYSEKTFIEDARLFFAFSDETKAATHLQIADTRIEELSRLPEDRSGFVEGLVEEYRYNLERGLDFAEQQVEQGGNASGLLARFQERLTYHQKVLQTVCNRVQVEARDAVEYALNVSGQGFDRACRLMARTHLENAARRINQVSEMAQAGRTDEVTELLDEYEEDLASFIEAASDTEDVEALMEQARETLRIAFDQVPTAIPDEARRAIENARLRTMQGFDETIEAVGRGECLSNAWKEFELDWDEFMHQWGGETAPGSEEWQHAWQEFRTERHRFSF